MRGLSLLALCAGVSCATLPPIDRQALAHSGDGKKILVVVTSNDHMGASGHKTGYWMSEVAHFHQVVTAFGYGVDFVSPRGGKPPLDERSRDLGDRDNQAFYGDAQAVGKLDASLTPSQIKAEDYSAIYYAGGHGPMWDLPDNVELQAVARTIYERGGVVAAVCHGPAGLLNIKLSDGKSLLDGQLVTGLSNTEESLSGHRSHVPFLLQNALEQRGAHYRSAAAFSSHVEISGRLITGQNPRSTRATAEQLVKLLAASPRPPRPPVTM
jgi:putative intracellular protease/amidase